jgi:20S proteasome subunit alpha 7
MSGSGAGYDYSSTTYSPQGKIYQIEYAEKSLQNSGTCIGIRCSDGIVFAVEKIIKSKLLETHSNRRIFTISKKVGMVTAGLLPDCRQIANRAMSESNDYQNFYGVNIPIRVLNDRLSAFFQLYTIYSHVRPFGCSVIFGSVDEIKGPQLYKVEPSGISYGYYGCAAGKNERKAKTEIEKLLNENKEMTCQDAIFQAAKIIFSCNDEEKDKDFILELSWISPQSNFEHQFVPEELYQECVARARASKDGSESSSEEEGGG